MYEKSSTLNIKCFYILFFLKIFNFCLTAQPNFNVHTFTTEDGLPSNSITLVEEDDEGYIWCLSEIALSRFDGRRFDNFDYSNIEEGNLVDFNQSPYKIKRGGIEGYIFFNKEKNCLQKITKIGNVFFNKESKFIYQNNAHLWLCDENRTKVYILNKSNLTIKDSIQFSRSISGHPIYLENNIAYIGTRENNFFIRYNIKTKEEQKVSFDKFIINHTFNTTHNILHSKQNKILTGSWGLGLLLLDEKNQEVRNFNFNKYSCIRDICFAPKLTGDSIVWCADAFNGIALFNLNNEKLITTLNVGNSKNELKSNFIQKLFSDSRGILWIATQSGLSQINPYNQHFFIKDFQNQLNENQLKEVFNTQSFKVQSFQKKYIFQNTMKEVQIFDNQSKKVIQRFNFNHNAVYVSDLNRNSSGKYENYFFIGNRDTFHIVNVLNNKAIKIVLPFPKNNLINKFIQVFKYFGGDTLWLGTNAGLFKYDLRQRKVLEYYNSENGIKNHDINDIQLKDRRLYVSTNDGIYLIDLDTKVVYNLQDPQNKIQNIALNFVKLSNGEIWANYLNKGLAKVKENGIELENVIINSLLPKVSIFSIYADSLNRFWLLTDFGLYCYDYNIKKLKLFNVNDGLPDINFNAQSSFFTINKNEIGITSIGSRYITFCPNLITFDTNSLSVHILQISNNGKNIPFEANKPLALNYNQNSLSFQVTAKYFSRYKNFKIRYRLNSNDNNWNLVDENNIIFFPNLDFGKYQLELQMSEFEGFEGCQSTIFEFEINPPIWRTWYAFIFYLIGLIFIINRWFAFRIKQKNILIQNQQLKLEKESTLIQERNRIATEMHDDIGGGLSTIRFLSEMAIDSNSEEDRNLKLSKISNSSKELIENMGDIIWALNTQNDNLESLIAQIRFFASEFAENNQIELVTNIEKIETQKIINGEKRRNILLCVKEAFHNIQKHSSANKVHLMIEYHEILKITIIDNGVFFDINNVKKGNGLSNMKQRISVIGGKMSFTFLDGTILQFQIPI